MLELIIGYIPLVIVMAIFWIAVRRQKIVNAEFKAMNQKALDGSQESILNQKDMIRLLEEQNALLKKLTEK